MCSCVHHFPSCRIKCCCLSSPPVREQNRQKNKELILEKQSRQIYEILLPFYFCAGNTAELITWVQLRCWLKFDVVLIVDIIASCRIQMYLWVGWGGLLYCSEKKKSMWTKGHMLEGRGFQTVGQSGTRWVAQSPLAAAKWHTQFLKGWTIYKDELRIAILLSAIFESQRQDLIHALRV